VLSALHTLEPDIPNLPDGLSPFGVGFIVWKTPIDILDRVFPGDGATPHPAAIWLFAGNFEEWIPVIRKKSPDTVIFVQVGGPQVFVCYFLRLISGSAASGECWCRCSGCPRQ